ncbi:putative defense protein [Periplaneta americana]|uniref:putative defense protein n=1 Tax=Periplaneta americana TaxID=6978 RepID=UPI0037E88039
MKTALFSVLVAILSLTSASPVPEDENQHISFAVTTERPSTTTVSLADSHKDLSSVCVTMTPAHNRSEAQTTPAPYVVSVSTTKVAPNGVVYVQVTGKENQQFRGFYVQARNENEEPVGEFMPTDAQYVSFHSCGAGQNNAASYVSRIPISDFSLGWFAPEQPTKIRFVVTFVETFSTFWIGVTSPQVTVENRH